jgi:3-methyladenine DNA glycosylase AlkC
MASLKDEISPKLVASIAEEFAASWPGFDHRRFVESALDGLADRELKARVTLVADALAEVLPAGPGEADRIIRDVLVAGGVQGWASLPVTELVAATMNDAPDIALPLLAALTSRFSAEFAIRPFIETHPEVTMGHLQRWVTDPDEHVRRLVSEGSRPRLPWAPQLRQFIADPAPTLPLLDLLFDDESDYVRRSVANHLNDKVTISCALRATVDTRAAIDYRVHYQGVNGLKAAKVFKLTTRDLPGGDVVTISRAHAFAHVSIRRIHPGHHQVDLQVNGHVLATADVDVKPRPHGTD